MLVEPSELGTIDGRETRGALAGGTNPWAMGYLLPYVVVTNKVGYPVLIA